jgi:hypothetical protein
VKPETIDLGEHYLEKPDFKANNEAKSESQAPWILEQPKWASQGGHTSYPDVSTGRAAGCLESLSSLKEGRCAFQAFRSSADGARFALMLGLIERPVCKAGSSRRATHCLLGNGQWPHRDEGETGVYSQRINDAVAHRMTNLISRMEKQSNSTLCGSTPCAAHKTRD